MSDRLIFRDAAGRELTARDLQGVTGEVNWEIVGGDDVPPEALHLHRQGRAAGGRGDYAEALTLLAQARALAPAWPYPVYDAAFTYLLQDDAAKAEELYAEVDRLAPRGFFTCKTTLDSLRRERAGALFDGFSKAFVTLEWIQNPAEKRAILEGIVQRFPTFPPAWKELAGLLDSPQDRLNAIERGLDGHPDAETRGMLLINKALILDSTGDEEEPIRILGELALDPDSTLATEALSRAALAHITQRT